MNGGSRPIARFILAQWILPVLVVSTFACPSPILGQVPENAVLSPEQVSENSFNAMKAGKVDEYARSIDPDELLRFKNAMLSIVEAAQAKKEEKPLLQQFDVQDVKSLQELSPADLVARLTKKQLTPEVMQTYSKAKVETLGTVMEGNDIAHCISQQTLPEWGTSVSIVSLKKRDSGWAMLLTSDLDKLIQSLQSRFVNRPADFQAKLDEVKVLGNVVKDNTAHVIYRSTITVAGTPVRKVAELTVAKADPEWQLVMKNDTPAIEKKIKDNISSVLESGNELRKTVLELKKRAAEAAAAEKASAASKQKIKTAARKTTQPQSKRRVK